MRRFVRPRLSDRAGNVLAGAWLHVYQAGTTTPVSLYAAASGGSALTQPRTTDDRGEVQAYLADGTGDIDLHWSDSGDVTGPNGRRVTLPAFTEFSQAELGGGSVTAADVSYDGTVLDGLGITGVTDVQGLDDAWADVYANLSAFGPALGTKIPKSIVDAAGDLISASGDNVPVRLPRGSALQVLRVNAAGTDLEYANASGGGADPPWYGLVLSVPPAPYLTNSEPLAFDVGAPWPFRGGMTGSAGGATSIGWDIVLSAGTWTFRHYLWGADYCSLETFKIDGVTIGDLANTGNTNLTATTLAGVAVASTGVKRLTVTTPGNTHYYFGFQYWRTA